jgi:hypothetical protein
MSLGNSLDHDCESRHRPRPPIGILALSFALGIGSFYSPSFAAIRVQWPAISARFLADGVTFLL